MIDHVSIRGHTLSRRTFPHPKIGKRTHQKSPREGILLKIGMIISSTCKMSSRIHPPSMDACKYNKIMFNLGGCAQGSTKENSQSEPSKVHER
jgi:hypothetical protein